MRTHDEFVQSRRARWEELEAQLAEGRVLHRRAPAVISRIAALYRSVCADLMRARAAGYDQHLVDHLGGLTARAHNALYGARPVHLGRVPAFFWRTFPRAVRANARFFWIATAVFWVPLIVALFATIAEPSLATTILPKAMLQGAAESYAEALEGRAGGVDAAMSGFYVHNNVGIAFQCFATGIAFGLGSLFFLLYNGVVIGVTVGWVIAQGHGANILTFVCGHGPFELTGICLSGAAGLRMGYALVRTEGVTRLESLRRAAPAVGAMIGGAALYLLLAAGIEGFWSPSAVLPPVKWAVAAVLSAAVVAHLGWAGRRGGDDG